MDHHDENMPVDVEETDVEIVEVDEDEDVVEA